MTENWEEKNTWKLTHNLNIGVSWENLRKVNTLKKIEQKVEKHKKEIIKILASIKKLHGNSRIEIYNIWGVNPFKRCLTADQTQEKTDLEIQKRKEDVHKKALDTNGT